MYTITFIVLLFPARAGMIPRIKSSPNNLTTVPRTRGDDPRLVANYARQIVDSMVGYFLGVPVRLTGDDEAAVAWLDDWGALNDTDDLDAELSKVADIYGHSYELMWRDSEANPRSSVVGPMNCFVVRDDTVEGRILFAVRFWLDDNRFDDRPDTTRGTLYDSAYETPFELVGGTVRFGEMVPHGFPDVPVVEYVDNEGRQGLFEPVMSLIDAHEKALSEKANDVEYYADAYLKVLGAELDEESLEHLRDSRIINLSVPRTRGDDPHALHRIGRLDDCSPHARG